MEGTRLGALTDGDGRYMILQVPPGEYEVVAQLLGYERTVVQRVIVNADLTTEVNFTVARKRSTWEP